MTQGESIKAIAAATNMSASQTKEFLAAIASLATKTVKKMDQLHLPGLGKLVGVQRKARMGRNPKTGKPIKIKAKKTVKFRLAKDLKQALNG